MPAPKTNTLIAPALNMGWLTGIELECAVSPIGQSAAPRRSWNGTLRNFAPDAFKQYRVVLSASGDALPPELCSMWPGKRFIIVPNIPFGGSDTGGRPVHSSFRVNDDGVHGVTGSRLYQYLQMEVEVVEPWEVSYVQNRAELRWQLTAEEWKWPGGGA